MHENPYQPRRTPHGARHRVPRRRTAGRVLAPLLIAVLALAGIGTMSYPAAASWLSGMAQSGQVAQYSQTVADLGPSDRAHELAAAQTYNDSLTGGAVGDPFASTTAQDSDPAAQDYLSQLSEPGDNGVMARIVIPSIDVDLPIYHGTSDSVLDRGVGHLYGTALPVGGAGTHAVLTGHRGLPESTLFTNLDRVKQGDTFEIDVYGQRLTYRVTSSVVVDPDQTESLRPVAGEDLVTLVTCTPIGINSQRILVTGERIPTPAAPPAPTISTAAASIPILPALIVLAVIALVLLGAWFAVRTVRRAHLG